VSMRPECTTTVLLEKSMVDVTEEWLEKEKNEENDANDRMCVVQCVDVLSQIDPESESCDEDKVGKDLDDAMEPNEAGETEQPDADRADGEENHEG